MAYTPGPILLIEDDADDQNMFRQAFEELKLPYPLLILNDGQAALEHLKSTHEQPFLILCDKSMPRMSGIELRQQILNNPAIKTKAIPFIFLSTQDQKEDVLSVYEHTVQGFFVKGNSQNEVKETLKRIVSYWEYCLHPNAKKFRYT